MMDEFNGDLDAFAFWDEHDCLTAEALREYTLKAKAKGAAAERERIVRLLECHAESYAEDDRYNIWIWIDEIQAAESGEGDSADT